MNEAIASQLRIRHESTVMQEYMSDLSSWTKSIKKKDGALRKVQDVAADAPANCAAAQLPLPRTAVQAAATVAGADPSAAASAAGHTYDKGYRRWENFDVDGAIEELDAATVDVDGASGSGHAGAASDATAPTPTPPVAVAAVPLQPASAARPDSATLELEAKDRGNAHYRRGDFAEAVRCYTRCVALNPRSVVAYSNRAMAQIKLKHYAKALSDCDSALRIDPDHVKSLSRRGTAHNSLGCHSLALYDFGRALELAPQNKQLRADVRKTREHVKVAARKAPRRAAPISAVNAWPEALRIPGEAAQATALVAVEPATPPSPRAAVASVPPAVATTVATSAAPRVESVAATASAPRIAPTTAAPLSPDATAAAAAAGRAAAASPAALLARAQPPKTCFAFEKVWRSLAAAEDPDGARVEYMQRCVKPATLKQILRYTLEPDMLADLIALFASAYAARKPKRTLQLLRVLCALDGFATSRAMLAAEDLGALAGLFAALRAGGVDAAKLAAVETAFAAA